MVTIAKTIKDADILALQEVVAKDPGGAQAVARLADQLNRLGTKWDYRISDPTNSPSPYRSERYAYLWKPSKVMMIGRPQLDKELATVCDREPFIGRFRDLKTKKEFILVNFHSRRYNEHPEDEVVTFQHYKERNEVPVIIAGDFNMDDKHPVFYPMYKQGYQAGIKDQATTLKRKCDHGYYLNHAIDNIFIPGEFKILGGGVIDFVKDCSNLETALMISDHVPVSVRIGIY